MKWLTEKLRGKEKVLISAEKIGASRVRYESEDINRVEVKIQVPHGAELTLELTPTQTYTLTQELMAAYQVMVPGARF